MVAAAIHYRERRANTKRLRVQVESQEDGGALIELAFMLCFLCLPLLAGTAEVARLTYDSIEITDAAHAGAAYGMQSTTLASDSTGMTKAAQADAADFGSGLTVTPKVFWVCSNAVGGTQYATQTSADSACTGSARSLEFVEVKTSATVTPTIKLKGLPASFTLSGISVLEVEQ